MNNVDLIEKTTLRNKLRYYPLSVIKVKLARSRRSNAKARVYTFNFTNATYNNAFSKLKRHITQEHLYEACRHIITNRDHYSYITICVNDIMTGSSEFYCSTIEQFITRFIALAHLYSGVHEDSPHFYQLDNSGMTDEQLAKLINEYYHNV